MLELLQCFCDLCICDDPGPVVSLKGPEDSLIVLGKRGQQLHQPHLVLFFFIFIPIFILFLRLTPVLEVLKVSFSFPFDCNIADSLLDGDYNWHHREGKAYTDNHEEDQASILSLLTIY